MISTFSLYGKCRMCRHPLENCNCGNFVVEWSLPLLTIEVNKKESMWNNVNLLSCNYYFLFQMIKVNCTSLLSLFYRICCNWGIDPFMVLVDSYLARGVSDLLFLLSVVYALSLCWLLLGSPLWFRCWEFAYFSCEVWWPRLCKVSKRCPINLSLSLSLYKYIYIYIYIYICKA